MADIKNYLWVFFISMLPVIELRGAIPVGLSLNLNPAAVFAVSVLGNMLPVPFIILFARAVFRFLKKLPVLEGPITRFESKINRKSAAVLRYKVLGLAVFVAIPLPGTGAWTGSLIAALLDIRLLVAVPAILAGVIVAGVIVTLVATGAFAGVAFIKSVLMMN